MKFVKWMALTALMTGMMTSGCSSLQSSDATSEEWTDADIKAEVIDRLSSDTITKKYNVGVISEGGIVTLDGSMADQNARFRAEAIARGTPGVKGVVNNLSSF